MTSTRFIAFVLLILSSSVFANDKSKGTVYYGGNLGFLDYSNEGSDYSTKAVYGRYGRYLFNNVALEGRIALRFGNDSFRRDNGTFTEEVDVELDYIYSFFARSGLDLSSSIEFYGILGYGKTRTTASIDGGASSPYSHTGMAWGFGLDFGQKENTKFNFEYTDYFDADGASLSGFAIGFVNYF